MSCLNVDNMSTARDLMKMVTAAHDYALIEQASTTTRIEVRPYAKRGPLVYGNTNRLLNSFGKLTPFGDSNRLRKWMLAKS